MNTSPIRAPVPIASRPSAPAATARQAVERQRAGEAVDQRAAVEQQARGQRAEHEVLEPGLGRAGLVAVERGHHVERQALQLEREVERQQAVGRDHHQHADGREQRQHRELEALDALVAEEVGRHDQAERRPDQDQDLEVDREAVGRRTGRRRSRRRAWLPTTSTNSPTTSAITASGVTRRAAPARGRGRRRPSGAPGDAGEEDLGDRGRQIEHRRSPTRPLSGRQRGAGGRRGPPTWASSWSTEAAIGSRNSAG